MGYTGNNHHAQKYDAKKAYDKDLTASARLHYLENSEHDKHAAKMYGDPVAKVHNGSRKGDQSDQHVDYANYKGTDKGYHGDTGSSHGDQSNMVHDYDKHPAKNVIEDGGLKGMGASAARMYGDPAAKMYQEPAPKFNAGLRAASAAGKLSGKFEDAVNAAPKMAGDMGHNVLAQDMRSNQMAGASGEEGYAGDASGATAPMMEALGKPAIMMKKGIASMCGMKK